MRFRGWVAFVVLGMLGCGGGSVPKNASPGEQVLKIGSASISFAPASSFSEVSNGSGFVSVFGVAGTTFNSFSFQPGNSLNETFVAWTNAGDIYVYSFFEGLEGPITTGFPVWLGACGISHDGRIACGSSASTGGKYGITVMNVDGSHQKFYPISTAPGNSEPSSWAPSWSPDNSTIAFSSPTGILQTLNLSSGVVHSLNTPGYEPEYSPDVVTLLYYAYNPSTTPNIYAIPSGGGSATLRVSGGVDPCWTPDGGGLVYATTGPFNSTVLKWTTLGGTQYGPTSNWEGSEPFVSPDGREVLYQPSNEYGPVPGVSSYLLAATISSGGYSFGSTANPFPRWSPFWANKSFIGAGAPYGSSCAGLLFSQGSLFDAFCCFTAKTPTTATITGNSNALGQATPLVYSLQADSVTSLSFGNGYLAAPTTVTVNAPQVIVTFGGNTGQVESLAPLAVVSPASTWKQTGKSTTCDGHFLAVYDRKGHNIAPHGASRISIDRPTGRATVLR